MEENVVLATRGFDQAELVKDLRRQVTVLEDDLRVRSAEVDEFATALRAEYDAAFEAHRTAATYEAWRDERVTQVAAAWVLGMVFVRFCEDNQLIEWPFIAGPGERLADAEERHEAFFREHPQLNDRDWIVAAIDHLAASHPTVAGLFDRRYNPMWEITPSFEAAAALLGFWRRRGDDGEIRYDFTDDTWDTRFLGDLYQDLSEHARKTYALLQTPEFVEEFILDLTLEPAVEEFGLKGLRTIDPACGSGHFLLGIFHRLLKKWRAAEPGTDDWTLIKRSMESVHGCDKNPFASSIARFRLLVAALKAADERRLSKASTFPINVAVGDSLLHGAGAPGVQGDLFESEETYKYRTEDVAEFASCDLLKRGSYHVVVGNPPYITPKDKQENENYRAYSACSGKYALSVPFVQCLFQLAIRTAGSGRSAGYVGQITANSFMKREFGKKLIEQFFPTVHLTHVIDTSGAYIPGHGTPTVILIGRNHVGRPEESLRAVLGVRGEPTQPVVAADGLVWSAIVGQVDKPGSESDWVGVEDLPRRQLSSYPWSLSGGGAGILRSALEQRREALGNRIDGSIGFHVILGDDEVFSADWLPVQWRVVGVAWRRFTTGDDVRDWKASAGFAIWPYVNQEAAVHLQGTVLFWPFRVVLRSSLTFGKTREERGMAWNEHIMLSWPRTKADFLLTFACVSTHNNFELSRGERLHNRHAPVIKLPEVASEDDHLALLGVLNSSTACFWLKQVSQGKGGSGLGRGLQDEEWEERYEFTGTKLQDFPMPEKPPLELGRNLDALAQRLASQEPSAAVEAAVPTRDVLAAAQAEHGRIRRQMIALQEELDWQVYGSYGLLTDAEVAQLTAGDLDTVPEIKLGERAFEIVLARKVAAGEAETAWFTRHGSTPITEIPGHWPQWYRDIVQARIDIIEKRKDIALIERPECKRRWATQPWEKKEAEALRTWLLDRCEKPDLWFMLRDGMKQPRALTVNQLADQFRDDADMQSVAQLYATDHLGKRDLTLAQVLESIVADQHVPYLAALRYKDSGLRKRQQWERTWELQREEDRTGKRLNIPVPEKYGSGDFRKTSYWSQRGKLDVPKERFISYPDANPDSDPSLLLGWAGWDHKDQAQALVNVVNDRTDQAGWDTDKIKPLLAGLQELMPWVRQWHGDYDDEWGGTPAEEYQAYLDGQRAKHQLTENDLREWRPAAATRGRKAKG
ncbi:BREX-2 system adenine-specific DNA-methyltransferase PglX [Kutzneria sp. CA-103260]|uniref:BREX-2 system adenine-specific DNA-methyltransferase PglX n=1 Tax=Kutzneria sp. CA-103260 TaxID=2802641 RepID=UPI001BAC31D8|nr:BREX-2 system adenine-specific DNA-methyltransferase PglX [Kutzneria sp. CA-103260]